MAAVFSRKFDWLSVMAAAGVFGFLLVRPAVIVSLRDGMSQDMPAAWAKVPTNGRFALLLPQIVSARYHDETLYAGCVRQILRHGLPYNPYWPDKRGFGDWVQNSLSFFVLAPVAALCGGNMTAAWCLSVALIGAAWFLLFYRVFFWWSQKRSVAYPLALFSILFPDLYIWLLDVNFSPRVNYERYFGVFFQYHTELRPNFYRLPSLFLSVLLLSCLFLGLWNLACQKSKRTAYAALLGLGFGLMAWVHPFEFVFGMSTLLVLTSFTWLTRSQSESRWNLAWAFLVALPVGILCTAGISLSVSRDMWKEHMALLSVVYSHRFYRITLIHLLFAALGWRLRERETDPRRRTAWLLLACAQVAIFLCRNLQVVTGFSVMPFHYIPLGSFMGCLMLFLLGAQTLARKNWWRPRLAAFACLVIVGWALANELVGAQRTYRLFGMPSRTEAAFDWTEDPMFRPARSSSRCRWMTNLTLPLYTKTHGYASSLILFTSPFTLAEYFEKTARLLKTVHADTGLFLAERWVLPGVRAHLLADEIESERVNAYVDTRRVERIEWFNSFLPEFREDGSVLKLRESFKDLVAKAEPLSPPYYLLVDPDDARFLSRPPESFGGRRVYQESGVSIYRFLK